MFQLGAGAKICPEPEKSKMTSSCNPVCREENVEFVCLPPNITDKMQPLDVAVFRGMKDKWRSMLHDMRVADPSLKALDKRDFPRNLRELLERCDAAKNLQSGFAKSGLYPLNPEKVLERLPRGSVSTAEMEEIVESELVKSLKVRRGYGNKKKPTGCGQKIPAGASYSTWRNEEEEAEKEDQEEQVESEEEQVESEEEQVESEVDPDDLLDDVSSSSSMAMSSSSSMVIAEYEGQWFPAEVCADQKGVSRGYQKLSYMQIKGIGMGLGKVLNSWAWPEKPDILVTSEQDILLKNITIEPRNSRGCFSVKECFVKKIVSLMVWSMLLFPLLLLSDMDPLFLWIRIHSFS